MAKSFIVILEKDGKQYFFGSIASIYDKFSVEEIGIKKQSLWSFGLDVDKPYNGKKCKIWKAEVYRKPNASK